MEEKSFTPPTVINWFHKQNQNGIPLKKHFTAKVMTAVKITLKFLAALKNSQRFSKRFRNTTQPMAMVIRNRGRSRATSISPSARTGLSKPTLLKITKPIIIISSLETSFRLTEKLLQRRRKSPNFLNPSSKKNK